MNFSQFMLEVLYKPQEYIALMIFFELVMYFVFRKQVISIIDNMTLMLVFMFGIYFANVFFMYINNALENIALLHFLLSMIMFIVGYKLWGDIEKPKVKDGDWNIISQNMYKVSLLVYVLTTFFLIAMYGSPLLSGESRIGFYKDAGVIKIINDVFKLCIIFLIIEKINVKKRIGAKNAIVLLILFVTLFLSGSKSSFSEIFIAYNLYVFYFTDKETIGAKFFLIFIPLFLLIIAMKLQGNNEFILLEVVGAVCGRGDVFVDFYGSGYDNVLNYYNEEGIGNFLLNVFYSVITRFRILSYDDPWVEYSWADKMSLYVHGNTFDGGVNNVFNVFSLTYLGFFGSIFATFLIGIVNGWIRNRLIYVFNMNNVFARLMFFIILIRLPFMFGMVHGFVDAVITSGLLLGITYSAIVIACKCCAAKGNGNAKKNKLELS